MLTATDVDSPCSEYDNGGPLHVAARNLALDSATVLLLHGAHPHSKDSLGKMPIGAVIFYVITKTSQLMFSFKYEHLKVLDTCHLRS